VREGNGTGWRHGWRRATGLAATGLLALVLALPVRALEPFGFSVAGGDARLADRLRGASLLLAIEGDRPADEELFATARQEYGRLIGALYAAGHYGGTISVRLDGREAADIPPMAPPRNIRQVTVSIDPGPTFVFAEARIAPLAPGDQPTSALAPGAIAASDALRDGVGAAVDGWRRAGHAMARPGTQDIVADHAAGTLSARIAIQPGPVVTFGRFDVSGAERVRPERIRAIAGFPEGERFDPALIERSEQRLRRTGAFASVAATEAEALGPGDTLDVAVSLLEAPRRRIGVGAEFDSEDGVRLSAFWLHRNLLGGAERLRIEGEIGGLGARSGGTDYRLIGRFGRPATFTPETTLFIDGVAERLSERDYRIARATVDVGISHIFTDRITAEVALGYRTERISDADGRRRLDTLALPLSVVRDARDDERNPTGGTYLSAGVTPFVGLTGADSGVQLRLDARGYLAPAGGDRLVLAARFQVGAVARADLLRTPRSYLFYSGGGGTVRGQPYQSLGVISDCPGGPPGCTLRTGGRGFAALSTELRAKVTDNIGVVGFVDAGYVSARAFGGGDWHAGAGVGLRYDTPIGPVRVDVGLPVRGATRDGPQLYIGIGQAF